MFRVHFQIFSNYMLRLEK